MGSALLAKKPMDWLLNEAVDSGEHTLKRSLGPVSLTALGVGAIIGAGIFVMSGLGAHYAGPGLMLSFVISGLGCGFAGLCYAEFAALIPLAGSAYTYSYAALGELFAWVIGWDLTLEYAMGASTVSSGWSNHFIEFLNIFGLKMPLWLAYDHWTALRTAQGIVARQMAHASDPGLVAGSQAFLNRVGDVLAAQSPELVHRAHDLVGAPHLFGFEIGFNLPAFVIALLITAVLVVGIKESASFNATIVVIKVAVVLFVIALGAHYVHPSNWGHDWQSFAPMGFSGIGAGAAYIFFAYIGFDAVSTAAQEARKPQRDMPIGIIGSLGICTLLYVLFAWVLTGIKNYKDMSPTAIYDALNGIGFGWLSTGVIFGILAGYTSVILVMLLGQSRVFFSMSRDGLLPGIFSDVHPRFLTPWRSNLLLMIFVSLFSGFVPLASLGNMTSIGTLLAFVIVCAGVMVMRRTNPHTPRPYRTPLVPLVPILGIIVCFAMMASLDSATWIRLVVWLIIGLAIYFTYSRHHSHLVTDPESDHVKI